MWIQLMPIIICPVHFSTANSRLQMRLCRSVVIALSLQTVVSNSYISAERQFCSGSMDKISALRIMRWITCMAALGKLHGFNYLSTGSFSSHFNPSYSLGRLSPLWLAALLKCGCLCSHTEATRLPRREKYFIILRVLSAVPKSLMVS